MRLATIQASSRRRSLSWMKASRNRSPIQRGTSYLEASTTTSTPSASCSERRKSSCTSCSSQRRLPSGLGRSKMDRVPVSVKASSRLASAENATSTEMHIDGLESASSSCRRMAPKLRPLCTNCWMLASASATTSIPSTARPWMQGSGMEAAKSRSSARSVQLLRSLARASGMVSLGTVKVGVWTQRVVTMDGVVGGRAAKPTSEYVKEVLPTWQGPSTTSWACRSAWRCLNSWTRLLALMATFISPA
mmetsp:Transcript_86750/g.156255  ORF Transcript_86750/g.156255 Transcript_86750/m.156255 type:complete len:248 (+) Transcript_86750:1364-2107(+)